MERGGGGGSSGGSKGPVVTGEMNSMVMREWDRGGVLFGVWGKGVYVCSQGGLGDHHGSRPLLRRRGSCGAQGYTGVYQRFQVGEAGGKKGFLPVYV